MSHNRINLNRRGFLRNAVSAASSTAALSVLPASIARALAIAANNRTGTIRDVEHIVCFMQENRPFDHYFASMPGVRGFADPFPIPVPSTALLQGKTVWYQRNDAAVGTAPKILAPQHNDTSIDFALIRTADTPHLYPDAQNAWDHGRMTSWPQFKHNASMVYYKQADIPFQYALADAFTLCDANHCSFTGGTNPNRCFFFTGTNHGRDDPSRAGVFNGPAMDNSYNTLVNGTIEGGYTWMTYPERLQDAGVTWQIYQDEEVDFFALNPLLGFKSFRDANAASVPTVSPTRTSRQRALYERGIKTRDLDSLRADVIAGMLPAVSWICATASGSEHPGSSSPAQGAAYIAQVLDALTANPDIWSKTVLILNFDENDGMFDHVPPPAPPSYVTWDAVPSNAVLAGSTTVDASDEYLGEQDGGAAAVRPFQHHPLGLGPRVPLYVISPWSKGGWINSQVFDQTSTIRFIEKRFGVVERNISPWRRAVVGDLTSCFNFASPNDGDVIKGLPETATRNLASRALTKTTTPPVAPVPVLPAQRRGIKPSRALPYEMQVNCEIASNNAGIGVTVPAVQLSFANTGAQAVVFHVYDRLNLTAIPRRFTVEPGRRLGDQWGATRSGSYDLWVLGPNGFHRHFTGNARHVALPDQPNPEVVVDYAAKSRALIVRLINTGPVATGFVLKANRYLSTPGAPRLIAARSEEAVTLSIGETGCWYDFSASLVEQADFTRRFAGRMETGSDSSSDPAMHGNAVGDQHRVG
jgi:phospholipase C